MPQPQFESLRERLLRAGIAPRHVRRYVGELQDHFHDLVREEMEKGATPALAESNASARLGAEPDLAEAMLEKPGLLSLSARFPWAVFGAGPVVLLIATFAVTILAEAAVLSLIGHFYHNTAHTPPLAFVAFVNAWNALPTFIAPLVIAGLLALGGARQRVSARWIVLGVVLACILGGFWRLHFSDDGYHGELMLDSGLGPPFPRDLFIAGVWRALANLAIAAVAWAAVARWAGFWRANGAVTVPEAAEQE